MAQLIRLKSLSIMAALLALAISGQAAAAPACGETGIALQILGSGGPRGDGRASAGYIIWIDGKARIMVDAGGGTFLRFKEAQANISDLDLLALSHFHPDHATEVPALLWLQAGTLRISGPTGSEGYPSLTEYLEGNFGQAGVFRAIAERMKFDPVEVDASASSPTNVLELADITVRGLGVPHGQVPTIGYRVDMGAASIIFASDQNGSNPAFAEFAQGADILVVHFAVPESAAGFITTLHAKPSIWGKMATKANAGTVVLSHLTALPASASPSDSTEFQDALAHLEAEYNGPVIIGKDLMCIPIR